MMFSPLPFAVWTNARARSLLPMETVARRRFGQFTSHLLLSSVTYRLAADCFATTVPTPEQGKKPFIYRRIRI
jgi:hypothetical protein